MKQLALLALPVLMLIISGCTLPGGIVLPGFDSTDKGESDVLVITSLTPYPATITTGQSLNLVAYVKNQGTKHMENIKIELYDHCDGLFTKITPQGCKPSTTTGCVLEKILPQETKQVKWTLEPTDVKLKTECELKVLVEYPFTTTTLTTVHFISPTELTNRVEQGTFREADSYIHKGEGPVKAYFTVQDTQPVAAIPGGHTNLVLNVENLGRGFIKGASISAGKLNVVWGGLQPDQDKCAVSKMISDNEPIGFIRQKSPPIPCQVTNPSGVERETTKQLTVDVEYDYEFRSSVKVAVTPMK